MIIDFLSRIFRTDAARVLVLRGGIVGLNFALMVGLAAYLGLGAFGRLMVLWGLALMASTAVSFGGPLLLLRALTDGHGMRPCSLLAQVVLYPGALAISIAIALTLVFPDWPWVAILIVGFFINGLQCMASIMRALGSIQGSMFLRDAGPQLALAMACVWATTEPVTDILGRAAIIMAVISVSIAIWCRRNALCRELIRPDGRAGGSDMALWGSSVLGTVFSQIDVVVGGALLSNSDVGLYALARRVANLIALPVTVATWVTAAPVSAAFGERDWTALRKAARESSRIAFVPGVVLFAAALFLLPVLQFGFGAHWPDGATVVCLILLVGALVQVGFTASHTVANLCRLAHYTALSRLVSVLFYLLAAMLLPVVGPITNALLYVLALGLGSIALWTGVRIRFGLDTSALALLHRREGRWSLS